jgi:hypothetical protein
MNINVKVNRTIRVNGKEYASLDEVPEEYRAALRAAMGNNPLAAIAGARVSVKFNGKTYGSVDDMPADDRSVYESALQAANTAGASSGDSAEMKAAPGGRLTEWPQRQAAAPGRRVRVSAGMPWWLVALGLVVALAVILMLLRR